MESDSQRPSPQSEETGELTQDEVQGNDTTNDAFLLDAFELSGDGSTRPSSNTSTLHRVDHYELNRVIGRGGFGIVFAARDLQLDRPVAVKIARAELAEDPKAINRFQTEAQAAARLEHPGIIAIFDSGVDNGVYFYVMPLLEGQNLASWLKESADETDQLLVARLMIEIAEAVHFGHTQGIVHRDLKPQNIMLKEREGDSSFPHPVVLDFGLCGSIEGTLATTTMLAGTPRYMSPEQALFGSRRIDERSDIYSLGVILYQLLTKVTPMAPETFAEAVLMLHNTPVEPLRVHRANLDASLETICLKCLRKDPERRYQSGDALAEDLRRFLANQPIHAKRQGLSERLEFGLAYGPWERIFGFSVILINTLIWIWAATSAGVIALRYGNDPTVASTLPQFILFIFLLALPIHIAGIYAGWTMQRKTSRYRFLCVMALIGFVWAAMQAQNLVTNAAPLEIYRGRGVAMTLVFLVIAPLFFAQSCFLAMGAWMAWRRANLKTNAPS